MSKKQQKRKGKERAHVRLRRELDEAKRLLEVNAREIALKNTQIVDKNTSIGSYQRELETSRARENALGNELKRVDRIIDQVFSVQIISHDKALQHVGATNATPNSLRRT